MKLNKIFLAAALFLGMVSCQEGAEWTPAPEVPEGTAKVYFQTPDELGKEVDPSENVTSHDVVVVRDNAEAELSIKINVIQNDSNKFTVPEAVTFAAGETTAAFTVGFEGLQTATTYTLILELDKDALNPYDPSAIAASYALSITPIKWDGKGVFVDGFWTEVPSPAAWYVDYRYATDADGNDVVIVKNPYVKAPQGATAVADELGIFDACPEWSTDYLAGSGNYNFTYLLDAANGAAWLEMCYMGYASGGSSIIVGMLDDLLGGNGYGAAPYIPEKSIVLDGVGGAAIGSDLYYFNTSFYFSKEAYVEANTPVESGRTTESYEGEFVLSTLNGMTGAEEQDTVAIAWVADYSLYLIAGMPNISYALAEFDEKTQLLHIPAQEGDSITVEGVDYGTLLYGITISEEGQVGLSIDDLIFIANEDGTITLDESSKVMGYAIVLTSGEDLIDFYAIHAFPEFAPVTEAAAAPALKKAPMKNVKTGKKFKSVLPLLNVNNLFIK